MVFSCSQQGWRAAPAVPSVPYNVTSICQDGAATVSWQHRGDNGTAAYTITAYANGTTPGPWATVTAPAAFGQVTGLTNSTPYAFTVKAANTAGVSAESPASGQNTPLANLIFGDDFGGPVIDPAWTVFQRDTDQSNSETGYYVPQNTYIDGSSHLVLHAANTTTIGPTYADGNSPTYTGPLVTRPYRTGACCWAYPGALAVTNQAYNSGNFTGRGFNFLFGKIQIRAQAPNLAGSGGQTGFAGWLLGSQCQTTTPLNPDNVAGSGGLTCNWHAAGSEELDVVEFTSASIASYISAWGTASGTGNQGVITVSSASTTFHTYELDWSSGSAQWVLDAVNQGTALTTSVPAAPMFLILDSTVSGTDAAFTTPDTLIDWIRVFHN